MPSIYLFNGLILLNKQIESMKSSLLAQSLTLPCGVTVPNRMAKSALSEGMAHANGRPSEALFKLYEKWGEGGIGIIFTGNVMVDKAHLVNANVMIAEDENFSDDYKTLANKAQAHGSHLWMQINHPGRQAPSYLDSDPVSASNVGMPSKVYLQPRALTESEIWDLIERYGNSALIAKQSGMKGVQIHGAHGYLVSQFLSGLTNIRTDQWGGSLENRSRFVIEIYKNIRAKVGSGYPVGIKINSADFQSGAFTETESMEVISMLSDEGMDLIEVSGGTYERAAMVGTMQKESTLKREAYFMDFIVKARKMVKVPLMLTGGFRSKETMENALANNELDMVGLGRPYCMYPSLTDEMINGNRVSCDMPDVKTGVEKIDMTGMLVTPWYMFQLHRLGMGLEPDPNMDPWMVYEKITGKPRITEA